MAKTGGVGSWIVKKAINSGKEFKVGVGLVVLLAGIFSTMLYKRVKARAAAQAEMAQADLDFQAAKGNTSDATPTSNPSTLTTNPTASGLAKSWAAGNDAKQAPPASASTLASRFSTSSATSPAPATGSSAAGTSKPGTTSTASTPSTSASTVASPSRPTASTSAAASNRASGVPASTGSAPPTAARDSTAAPQPAASAWGDAGGDQGSSLATAAAPAASAWGGGTSATSDARAESAWGTTDAAPQSAKTADSAWGDASTASTAAADRSDASSAYGGGASGYGATRRSAALYEPEAEAAEEEAVAAAGSTAALSASNPLRGASAAADPASLQGEDVPGDVPSRTTTETSVVRESGIDGVEAGSAFATSGAATSPPAASGGSLPSREYDREPPPVEAAAVADNDRLDDDTQRTAKFDDGYRTPRPLASYGDANVPPATSQPVATPDESYGRAPADHAGDLTNDGRLRRLDDEPRPLYGAGTAGEMSDARYNADLRWRRQGRDERGGYASPETPSQQYPSQQYPSHSDIARAEPARDQRPSGDGGWSEGRSGSSRGAASFPASYAAERDEPATTARPAPAAHMAAETAVPATPVVARAAESELVGGAVRRPAAGVDAAPDATGSLYVVQPNDSYWIISKKLYGDGSYFKALHEHNRRQHPRADQLQVGDQIAVMPVDGLRRTYPDLCPKLREPAAAAGTARTVSHTPGRIYVVEEGDTLFDIAKYELGSPAKWVEIYELNKGLLSKDFHYLKPGLELLLPGERNRADALTRRPGEPTR